MAGHEGICDVDCDCDRFQEREEILVLGLVHSAQWGLAAGNSCASHVNSRPRATAEKCPKLDRHVIREENMTVGVPVQTTCYKSEWQ